MDEKGKMNTGEYEELIKEVKANSPYKRLSSAKKKWMSVSEMGELLGLKKTDRYWLVHKNFFETKEIAGKMRVNIESFEKWYANQIKYHKVNGEEPGKELKEWSYSVPELAEMLEVTDGVVYDLIKRNNIEVVIVDYWKRVPKAAFQKWYDGQSRYRTKEDKKRDAEMEAATLTMPEMGRQLGITRNQVYGILNSQKYQHFFEFVTIADRKRITKESFQKFLDGQDEYHLDPANDYEELAMEENVALANYRRKKLAQTGERNGKFNVIYSYTDADGKRKQKWETYATKAEAKKRKKEIEYKEEMGSMIIPQCKTMKDLLAEYVALYGKDNWALSTYDGNVSLINNYILPIIGDEKLSEINTRFIEKYYQRLLKAPAVVNPMIGKRKNEYVSTSTIRDIHKLLRSCFKQAVKWELMEKNPCIYATVPKHKTKKREIWTAETLMYALEVCEDDRLKLAMNLSFSCSLRISELLGLTWDCVDISEEAIEENRAYLFINKESQRVSKSALKELDAKDVLLIFPEKSKTNKTVRVLKTPKTDSSVRKVFLPKSVAKMLIEWKEKQDETKEVLGDEYMDYNLVMASTFGLPLGDGAIRKPLNQLIKDYDLPPVVFHSLRHSSVTYKLKLNGGDIKAVQGDSGHAQVSMVTDVYSHILDDDRKKNAELFEEAFYEKKNLDPQMHPNTAENTVAVPEGVDAELLAKVLNNPEMAALLASLAKTMK